MASQSNAADLAYKMWIPGFFFRIDHDMRMYISNWLKYKKKKHNNKDKKQTK